MSQLENEPWSHELPQDEFGTMHRLEQEHHRPSIIQGYDPRINPAPHWYPSQFQWTGDSPHSAYFKGTQESGPRNSELRQHLESDHGYERSGDEMHWGLLHETPEHVHRGLDELHRHAHETELGPFRAQDPGGTSYQQLENGHRWLQEETDADERERQAERDEHMDRTHVNVHGETSSLRELEDHLRSEHGIPRDAFPEYHHPADDSQYTAPYESELEELHDQDHGEMGTYGHENESSGSYPEIHGHSLHESDAIEHLRYRHGEDGDELRRGDTSEYHLERLHNEAHDRDEGRSWEDHHRDDRWDPGSGDIIRSHRTGEPEDEDDEEPDRPEESSSAAGFHHAPEHEMEYDPVFGWRLKGRRAMAGSR